MGVQCRQQIITSSGLHLRRLRTIQGHHHFAGKLPTIADGSPATVRPPTVDRQVYDS